MDTLKMTAATVLLTLSGLGGQGAAANSSLAVCGDLSAKASDVAFHCGRAIRSGSLSTEATFAAQLNLGDAMLELHKPAQALDAFDAAAATGLRRVELHVGRAMALEDLRRRSEAAESWRMALAAAPDSLDVRLGEGAFHLRGGDLRPALVAFDAALAIAPRDADALFNRGLTHIALNQMEAAVRDFSRLLEDAPSDAGAYHHRARAQTGWNDDAALRDFERASSLSPEWAAPWFLSGKILDRIGRADAANERFRRAFELGYQDPWLLERVRSLGG